MYISQSNDLTISTVTVPDDPGANPLQYLLNRDFSEIYRSGTSSNFFRIEMELSDVGYIGISGLDVFGKVSEIDFEYWDGVAWVVDANYQVTSDRTIMHINTSSYSYEKWRITLTKILSNQIVGISYLAAGRCWMVPNGGEESGYSRPWSAPAFKQRTQNNLGMPTATVIESTGIKGSVKFNNITNIDIEEAWVPIQGYSVINGVFIVEEETRGDRAYYCYNCQPSPVKAHAQTRSLQNVSMKFDCWTGNVL